MRTEATGAYIRVSTHGQNEAGQKREIKRWLEGHGISDARWYVDKGNSGDNLNRPAFEQLQRDIFAGDIKTVVVFKLDRISRSLKDGINTLCGWLDKGIRLVSVTQGHDFAGTTGKMIASVLFSIAELETQTRQERQAAGIAEAKANGVYFGRKPGTFKAKPKRAQQLRERGLTDDEIGNALGVSRRSVQRYLNDYSGVAS